jgi:hypothetical protein
MEPAVHGIVCRKATRDRLVAEFVRTATALAQDGAD